ncbi:MAG: hypothetical protein H5T91_05805 [Synergistetes bacterium]|nr:hypothetical protein [Synergistota bacterium]MDK2871886.1 hypothetical protein [bacterium]
MRRVLLLVLAAFLLLGISYLYYSGGLTVIFPFASYDVSPVFNAESVPVVYEDKIDALIKVLEDFPKSEGRLKKMKVNLSELKDPFLLEPENLEGKIEVKVNPEGNLVVELPPPMKLEGIIEVGSKRLAVLQIGDEKGIILAQGEKRGDIKVVKVERGRVVVVWRTQVRFLELEESR